MDHKERGASALLGILELTKLRLDHGALAAQPVFVLAIVEGEVC
jgi:hypothetical protein